jgi:hypothetical protein
VSFFNDALDGAAAKQEWTCEWDFGDGLTGKGWKVAHYFELRKGAQGITPFPITARLRDENGNLVADAAGKAIEVTRTVDVRPSVQGSLVDDRAWTESLKLTAALLIAVFGLVAGARDQLLKLDILPGLVAVFLVGFGADTIKSLLTTKN